MSLNSFKKKKSSSLWRPLFGSEFLESQGWVQRGNLRYTELNSEEKSKPREMEYLRARAMFYNFIGRDKAQNFELSKVIFLDNSNLEVAFEKKYKQLRTANIAVASKSGVLSRLLTRQLSTERFGFILNTLKDAKAASAPLQSLFITLMSEVRTEIFTLEKLCKGTFEQCAVLLLSKSSYVQILTF